MASDQTKAAEVPEAMGDELAWLDGEDFNTALIRYRGAHCFQDQDGIVDRLQAVKDIIRAQWQSTRLRGGVPEGWSITRKDDGRIVVKAPNGDAWAWANEHSTGTSNDFVYAFLSALTAAPQAPAPSSVFAAWWATQGQSMQQHASESPAEFARRLATHAWTEATRAAMSAQAGKGGAA